MYTALVETARDALLAQFGMGDDEYHLKVSESVYGTVQVEVIFVPAGIITQETVRVVRFDVARCVCVHARCILMLSVEAVLLVG